MFRTVKNLLKTVRSKLMRVVMCHDVNIDMVNIDTVNLKLRKQKTLKQKS
jgi:hypothetical protein